MKKWLLKILCKNSKELFPLSKLDMMDIINKSGYVRLSKEDKNTMLLGMMVMQREYLKRLGIDTDTTERK